MKATRILTAVLTLVAGLVAVAVLIGRPAGSGAAPDLTVTPSATPRYRAHLPHVRFDASPTPPPTPVVTPTRTPHSAAAALTITRFKAINASTFNSSSFVVGNDSLNGERLSELRIDLSTALLPDVVFDPFGQAGDAVAKSYTLDGGLKQASYVFEQPHDGGFDVLVVRYNGFDPGDRPVAYSKELYRELRYSPGCTPHRQRTDRCQWPDK